MIEYKKKQSLSRFLFNVKTTSIIVTPLTASYSIYLVVYILKITKKPIYVYHSFTKYEIRANVFC